MDGDLSGDRKLGYYWASFGRPLGVNFHADLATVCLKSLSLERKCRVLRRISSLMPDTLTREMYVRPVVIYSAV